MITVFENREEREAYYRRISEQSNKQKQPVTTLPLIESQEKDTDLAADEMQNPDFDPMECITFRGEGNLTLSLTLGQLQNIVAGQYDDKLEGRKCFRVTPGNIDRELFQTSTNNNEHEWYRNLILEAFYEWDMNPEKYLRSFDILTSKALTLFGSTYHKTDWVEIALAWAQFIYNGASWGELEALYSDENRIYFTSVIWKDGEDKYLGFSYAYHRYMINTSDYYPSQNEYKYAVPAYTR